jgi:hypothetical protein
MAPICAICAARELASSGKLELNKVRADTFTSTYKTDNDPQLIFTDNRVVEDEDDDRVTVKAESQIGDCYFCPYCDYAHFDHRFEVETMYEMDESAYEDTVGEHVYSGVSYEELQVVTCEETKWRVGGIYTVPELLTTQWSCSVCEEFYIEQTDAERCCSSEKGHLP